MLEGELGAHVPAKGVFSPQLPSPGSSLCVSHRSEYHCVLDDGLHILVLLAYHSKARESLQSSEMKPEKAREERGEDQSHTTQHTGKSED